MNSKITHEIAQQIIDEYCDGSSTYELGDKYGLWQTSICNLIRGHSWPQCKRPGNIKELIKQRHEKGLFEKGRKFHIDAPPLTDFQMDIVVGSLLGDGGLRGKHANCSFNKTQRKDRLDYLKWHQNNLEPYSVSIDPVYSKEKLVGGKKGVILERKKTKKRLSGYRFRTHQHPTWTELRNKWYKDKIKVVPSDLVLNEQKIAIWYCDDGSNDFNNRTAVMCTQSFTTEEADFLIEKLKNFDLHPVIMPKVSEYTGRTMPILKFSKSSYDNLIQIVKPYMLWDCFSHKVKWRPARKQWETSGKFTPEKILEIKEMRKTKTAKEIAKIFDVHVNTIFSIVSGRSWSFVK